MKYQVRCTTGRFESTWINACNVRMCLRKPAPFHVDGPCSKIRWREGK